MSFDYDLFVIGGGSGGVRAARIAASQHGARVAIAEESRFGGTCVIRGCVPKKLMHHGAHFADYFAMAGAYGWDLEPPEGRFERLLENRNREIARERLAELIGKALPAPRPRIATRPTLGSQRRRLAGKALRGTVKALRGRVAPAEEG